MVEINPWVKLEKGKEYPFISMGVVEPNRRYVSEAEHRIYNGGGAKFLAGDILFARITPCLENGKIAQYKPEGISTAFGSTEFFIFRSYPSISDPGYIYYLAKSDLIRKPAEKSMSGASGRQRADLSSIKNLKVPAPPLPTQRKITAILSAYDDLIENNIRRIKILEEMAQALYREWFVHFRFPGHEKARLIDSPLGKIPEGWEVKELKDVCHLIMGQSPKSKYYNTDKLGLPFHQGVTDFGNRFPNKRFYCSIKGRIADKGDILFSVRAPVGRI
ncbi:MAG: restriction endonuclease subunit S, partial [Dethiobacteria bacterium]